MALRSRRRKERGQILVLFEIVLIVILGFTALVVDLGFLRNDRQSLVNAVDAGALAGGTVLPVTGPTEAAKANGLIAETVQSTFPALTSSDYTIAYKCLIPAGPTGSPQLNYIPSSCDPRISILGNASAPVTGLTASFVGAGPHRYTSCNPSVGDKCNVVVVTASKITKFNIAPIIGVNQGSTGSISSAACQGAGCGQVGPPQPVDLVIILDRTGSMKDGTNPVGTKIQSLISAAKAVLSVYDPAIQRVGLGLTGPGAVDGSGKSTLGTCYSGGSGYGVADDQNFSPTTTLQLTGSTTLRPQANFLNTTITAAIANSGTTATISVASKTGFPTTYPFTIQVDTEQMTVNSSPGSTTWAVTRAANGTTRAAHVINSILGWGISKTDTTIRVASTSGFPSSYPFTIIVGTEQMSVTASPSSNVWTVTRGFNSTTTAVHGGTAVISQIISSTGTSIQVASASGFPSSGSYTIQIDSEYMRVTAGAGGTTWTVTRGVDGSTKATHTTGATVSRVVGQTDTSIQVGSPYGPAFPSVPFTIAIGTGGSGYEHMTVTAVSGSSAPYTWTVSGRGTTDSTPADDHANGETVDGVTPWVPNAANVGVWVPVGLSGTDTDTPLPNPNGTAGTYSVAGVPQASTPLVSSINCISASTNGTNLATPLLMAKWWLDTYGRPGVTEGIILETDGHPQVGFESGDQTTTNQAYTCQAAIDAANAVKADTKNSPAGIQMFTVSYGADSSCPTRTTNMADSNSSKSIYETTTWSGKSAASMLCAMATAPSEPFCFTNPAASALADDFKQAATQLAKGTSRLIQLYPAPVVSSVTSSAPSVSIGGEYFTGASSVYFGGTPAASFSVGSDTGISAVAPTSLVHGQQYAVTVSTPGGISVITPASYYTYP